MPSSTGIPAGELLPDIGSRTVHAPHHRPEVSLPVSRAARSVQPAASTMRPAGHGSGGYSCPQWWNWQTRRYRWFRAIRAVRPGRDADIHFCRTRSWHPSLVRLSALSHRHAVENRMRLGCSLRDFAIDLDSAPVAGELAE